MNIYYEHLIFIVSFLIFSLTIIVSYFVGKKFGIKKALYRITYTAICVIFAFILSPYVNEYILNYNLYDDGKAIRYNGLHFYRVIDFIEEVIVHNKVLNDIYVLLPSLKDLLMDFPQLLFVPITFFILFIVFKILFFPLYLFLSYKRKRRVLYDKEVTKSKRVGAGLITAVHSVFLISIVLTPISGLARLYKEASSGLVDKGDNICNQTEYLSEYKQACSIIEAYNSSVFGLVANMPGNKYIYDSLTRIEYNDVESNLNDEIVNIARAGIILNKTGLLKAISVEDFSDVSQLNFNEITKEDIDIIVKAFEESMYTREVLYDVYKWSRTYLDWLVTDVVNLDYKVVLDYEEIIEELRVVLSLIKYVINNTQFLTNINEIYQIISDFLSLPVDKRVQGKYGLRLFFDLAYTIDIDSTKEMLSYLKDSHLFVEIGSRMVEKVLSDVGIITEVSKNPQELYQAITYGLNVAKIVQNHKYVYDILKLVNNLTIEEINYIGEVVSFLSNSDTMSDFLYTLLNFIFSAVKLKLDIPVEILYEIRDWPRELELAHLVIQIVYTYLENDYIDYDKAWYGLTNYNDTVLFKRAFKFAIELLPEVFTMWIAGKDYKYLVGEYV